MRILKQKLKIKAPIEHVYSCSTDINYLQEEMERQAEGRNIKIKYNTRKPFDKDNEIIFISKKPILKIRILENIHNKLIKSLIIPKAPPLNFIGESLVEAKFITENTTTIIDLLVTSVKPPKLLWRILIKIMIFIMRISTKKDEKRFVKYVESTS